MTCEVWMRRYAQAQASPGETVPLAPAEGASLHEETLTPLPAVLEASPSAWTLIDAPAPLTGPYTGPGAALVSPRPLTRLRVLRRVLPLHVTARTACGASLCFVSPGTVLVSLRPLALPECTAFPRDQLYCLCCVSSTRYRLVSPRPPPCLDVLPVPTGCTAYGALSRRTLTPHLGEPRPSRIFRYPSHCCHGHPRVLLHHVSACTARGAVSRLI